MTVNYEPKTGKIQMAFLGLVSLLIGVICMIDVTFVYGLSPLTSISESATTGTATGMLLPFALGCMATYCIAYQGYCRSERVIVRLMALGFAIVAMQTCNSQYITDDKIGLLGLAPAVSNIVHGVGAVIGFGAMFIWIAFYFTQTNPDAPMTKQKIKRNRIYTLCSGIMGAGIAMLIISLPVDMGNYMVFIAEEFMLIPAGFAVLVKSGMFCKDK